MSMLDKYLITPLFKHGSLSGVVGTSLFLLAGAVTAVSLHFHLIEENPTPTQLYVSTIAAVLVVLIAVYLFHFLTSAPSLPPGTYASQEFKEGFPQAPKAPLREEFHCKNSQWVTDNEGRRVLLRGVNLGGATKLPTTPNGATYNADALRDPAAVSFVGRPFPLEEADIHLGRLRAWGYTFLRFLITWEAVEHSGPGEYDEEYLDYLLAVIQKCKAHGISVFIDPHQDVWSRWTGGDGAPGWTLQLAGFDLGKLFSTGSAITHQGYGDPFPKMVWVTNYKLLATSTMFTLFFGGDDFAPNAVVDASSNPPKLVFQGADSPEDQSVASGKKLESIQSYLQRHYCNAMGKVANKLKNETNVVGFDTLNEPSAGYIARPAPLDSTAGDILKSGWRFDPFTGFKLGAGFSQQVDFFNGPFLFEGKVTLNPKEESAWVNGPTECIWRKHGVWDIVDGKPKLLKPTYFKTNPNTGKPINFVNEYLVPLWRKVAKAVRAEIPDAVMFGEPNVDLSGGGHVSEKPRLSDESVGNGYVYAKHYYDGITLMTKSFWPNIGLDMLTQLPVFGNKSVVKAHSKVIKSFKEEAKEFGSTGAPVLIGEIGIPFDMNSKEAFKTGNFARQVAALNTTLRALEDSLVSFTLWNYTPDNSNLRGDLWNDEDLSLFSKDQLVDPEDIHSGGRALAAAVRPYPYRVCGTPLKSDFDPYSVSRKFFLEFEVDPKLETNETIIFLPRYQYPLGVVVEVSKGSFVVDWEQQTLVYRAPKEGKQWIKVTAAASAATADA